MEVLSLVHLPRAIVRGRVWVAAFWIAAALALMPAAARVGSLLDVAAHVPGSESAAVEESLAARFGSPFAKPALLVVTGVPAPDTPEGRRVLQGIVEVLAAQPGVARTLSYLDGSNPEFIGPGAGTFLLIGLDPGTGPADVLIPPLRDTMAELSLRLRREHAAVSLRLTGETALNVDLRQTAARQGARAEVRVLPVTLILLLLAFGTMVAAGLPILLGCLAIVLALGGTAFLAEHWRLSILLRNVVSMLGLGLGIDYALLVVSRFRESLAAGRTPESAAEEAVRHAGHTVAVSGAAVVIGFLGLFLVPLNEARSVAVGGLLVVGASVLLATTLLPGLLAWLGPRVDAGRIFRRRDHGASGEGWRRWGRWVAAHPGRVLFLAGTPVVLLALQATRLKTDLPRGDWLPPEMESARGLHDLQAMGHSGVVQTVRVLLELPEEVSALGAGGWAATERLGRHLAADPRVARVRSLPRVIGEDDEARLRATLVPYSIKSLFVSEDGAAALVEAVPREDADPNELKRLVRELRSADAAAITGVPGARLRVGGLPAFNVDYADAVAGRLPRVIGFVVGGTLVALALGFRSLWIPIKAVALNLLSVAAAFGATVLAFQDGYGAWWLGLAGPTGGTFPAVPVMVFCIVFGLSMDYEVFLVARVAEARRAGHDDAEAVAEGLARTAGLITSAAAVMVAVFGAFTLGGFLLVKMLGFALATAVLIDATLIRVAVGPALIRLAGRWNWWPGDRAGGR